MSHINFLPKDEFDFSFKGLENFLNIENLRKIPLNRLTMVIIAGSILVFMFLFGTFQKFRLDSILDKKTNIGAEVSKIKSDLSAKGMASVATGKGSAILQYEARTKWSSLLHEIANAMPGRIWLTSLKGGGEVGRAIELGGEAVDQSAVASLIKSLKTLKEIRDVNLVSSNTEGTGDNQKVIFEVLCKIK